MNRHERRKAAAKAKPNGNTYAEAGAALAAMRAASPVVVFQAVPTAKAADGTWTTNPTDRERAQMIVRRMLDDGAAPPCPCGVRFAPKTVPGTVWFIATKERTGSKMLHGVFCPACSDRIEAEGLGVFARDMAARLGHGDIEAFKPHEMHAEHPTPQ